MIKSFPTSIQHDAMDCGASCINIIMNHYGAKGMLSEIKEKCTHTREGV